MGIVVIGGFGVCVNSVDNIEDTIGDELESIGLKVSVSVKRFGVSSGIGSSIRV